MHDRWPMPVCSDRSAWVAIHRQETRPYPVELPPMPEDQSADYYAVRPVDWEDWR